LLKLLEAQRHDLRSPLEERWPEIQRWLTTKTAGEAARDLELPESVVLELMAVVKGRNIVAHHVWRFYLDARQRHGDRATETFNSWLDDQARIMGLAYNATMDLVTDARDGKLDEATAEREWRSHFPDPLTPPKPPAS
jgi:hypothetical protein